MTEGRTEEVFRCFCYGKCILGVIKTDDRGKPFVHIKIYKARRIYGEILLKYGDMRVRCRDCYRWHTIRIVKEKVSLEEVPDEPDIVDLIPDPR